MSSEKPAKPAEKTLAKLVGICSTCNKPQRQLNKGSITAWIFGSSSCSCITSEKPVTKIVEAAVPVVVGKATESNESESVSRSETAFPDLGERYEVLEHVGHGGMGSVYKVRDLLVDKTFAIKLLKDDLSRDKDAVKRFQQEAEAAMRLTHPNLGSVYEHGQVKNGAPYLVMDFFDGCTLDQLIKREKLSLERSLDIFAQVCEALDHAHLKGVIHRDLKPSNIIITRSPEGNDLVRVVDFGIAKVLSQPGETLTSLTQTGDIFGSPLYMSPEQCKGDPVDVRSDIYSLGCVFYEVFAGRPPFIGKNWFEVMSQQVSAQPTDLLTLNIPDHLKKVMVGCLHKDRAFRYANARDLYCDIIAVANGKRPKYFPTVEPPKPPAKPFHRPIEQPPVRQKWEEHGLIDPVEIPPGMAAKIVAWVLIGFAVMVFLGNVSQVDKKSSPSNTRENVELTRGAREMANKYYQNREFEKAIPLLELLIVEDKQLSDNKSMAYHRQHLAECYSATGDVFNARKQYRDALALFDTMGPNNAGGKYSCLMSFARHWRKEGNEKEAVGCEQEAYALTKKKIFAE